jgi:hypothetical protein
MNKFGWSYPPGVTSNDIDEQFGDKPLHPKCDEILNILEEWRGSDYMELTEENYDKIEKLLIEISNELENKT